MHAIIEPATAALLGHLQESVPFTRNPFHHLGQRCGLSEAQVLTTLKALKEEKVIRQISAIFDTRSLGYSSSLVAAKVDPESILQAVEVINSHPGVSHNYLRNHDFNLWYTIAVPPTSTLGLEKTVDLLHQLSGAESTRLLPTLRLFKIGVRFEVGSSNAPTAQSAPAYTESNRRTASDLSIQEIEFIRLMQLDLPLIKQPFVATTDVLGMTFEEAQKMHERFLKTGRMRRFAAVLHHRKVGFRANAMGVWAAPTDDPAELGRLGEIMAGFSAVSHCYQRPTYQDWPYNLFTMVHGRSRNDCEETLAAISAATGLGDSSALYSTREFKKTRVRYFTGEEMEWERELTSRPLTC